MSDSETLRRFRHRFRNIYKSQLRVDRVLEVSEIAVFVSRDFGGFHREFISWIRELLAAED